MFFYMFHSKTFLGFCKTKFRVESQKWRGGGQKKTWRAKFVLPFFYSSTNVEHFFNKNKILKYFCPPPLNFIAPVSVRYPNIFFYSPKVSIAFAPVVFCQVLNLVLVWKNVHNKIKYDLLFLSYIQVKIKDNGSAGSG